MLPRAGLIAEYWWVQLQLALEQMRPFWPKLSGVLEFAVQLTDGSRKYYVVAFDGSPMAFDGRVTEPDLLKHVTYVVTTEQDLAPHSHTHPPRTKGGE